MHAIHRILVTIRDPAARTQRVLAKAGQLALKLQADVQLFHAIPDRVFADLDYPLGFEVKALEEERRAGYQQQLEQLARPLRRRGLNVTTAAVWDYPTHEAIIRNAMQFGADLIIAAGHASRHHLPWLLRYTDWELLRCSPIPVLLIKNGRPWRRPAILAAVDPSHAFAKPSGLDGEILRCGLTLAEALKGKFHALYAYAPMSRILTAEELKLPGAVEREVARTAKDARSTLAAETDPYCVPHHQLHVVGRHPADAIRDTVRECGAQITVMGSISRSGLDRLVIGNTAETLIDELDCDILLAKPPYFHHGVARTPRGIRVTTLPAIPGVL